MAEKRKINVKVGGKEYAFNININDEEIFRKAAKLVDSKYAKYLQMTKLEPKDCLAIIAIESYVNNFRNNDENEGVLINHKLGEIFETLKKVVE